MASGGAGHRKQITDHKPEVLDFEGAPPLSRDDLIERIRGAAVIYSRLHRPGIVRRHALLATIAMGWMASIDTGSKLSPRGLM